MSNTYACIALGVLALACGSSANESSGASQVVAGRAANSSGAAAAAASRTVGRWEPLPAPPSEFGSRAHAGAVFDGQRAYIWGGSGGCGATGNAGGLCNDGAIYEPEARSWKLMAADSAPAARQAPALLWAADKLWVFGGACARNEPCVDGASYDPVADRWQPVMLPTWLEPRIHPYVGVSGTRITLWGGQLAAAPGTRRAMTATGGQYDVASGEWTQIATDNAPAAGSTVVMLGEDLLAPVGPSASRYAPGAQAWEPLSVAQSPASCCSELISTGSQLLGWDGKQADGDGDEFRFDVLKQKGFVFDGSSQAWRAMAAKPAPIPLPGGAYVWTGEALILWGGSGGLAEWGCAGHLLVCNYGALYDPAKDSWTDLSTQNAPAPRGDPVALWLGDSMLVYGGTTTVPPDTYANGALLYLD